MASCRQSAGQQDHRASLVAPSPPVDELWGDLYPRGHGCLPFSCLFKSTFWGGDPGSFPSPPATAHFAKAVIFPQNFVFSEVEGCSWSSPGSSPGRRSAAGMGGWLSRGCLLCPSPGEALGPPFPVLPAAKEHAAKDGVAGLARSSPAQQPGMAARLAQPRSPLGSAGALRLAWPRAKCLHCRVPGNCSGQSGRHKTSRKPKPPGFGHLPDSFISFLQRDLQGPPSPSAS